jgi:hypothetical protein
MITMIVVSSINKLLVACLVFGLPVLGVAQSNLSREVRATVIMWADFDCFTATYPKGKLDKVVKLAIVQDGYSGAKVWGDRAFAFDLNGDRKPEYILPLTCSAVGNCAWGIFSVNPARLLGVVHGENVYIRRRTGRWSALTVYIHISSSDGLLDTYVYRNRRYGKLAGFSAREAPPYPKFMETITSPCKKQSSE